VTKEMQDFYIQQLQRLGYGDGAAAVIDYLITRAIDDMLRTGLLKPR
jgi:hypothetical protein